MFFFLKAWIIGITVAAPIGPIGMLCIKKTIDRGINGAILVGLGAALADSFYGFFVVCGLSVVSSFLIKNMLIIRLIGALMLFYLAYKELQNNVIKTELQISKTGLSLIGEAFLLTIMNPMTILSFIAIYTSVGVDYYTNILQSFVVLIGIFFGSMTWWCILGSVISKIKCKLPPHWLFYIKYISCILLTVFGILTLIEIINFK